MNIPIHGKCDKVGSTGEKYIVVRKSRCGISYQFLYKRKAIKTFHSIEEAADFRDKWLKERNIRL